MICPPCQKHPFFLVCHVPPVPFAVILCYGLRPSCEVPVIQGVQTVFIVPRHFHDLPARDAPPLSPQVFSALAISIPGRSPLYSCARRINARSLLSPFFCRFAFRSRFSAANSSALVSDFFVLLSLLSFIALFFFLVIFGVGKSIKCTAHALKPLVRRQQKRWLFVIRVRRRNV